MAEELEKITVLLEERWMNKIASLQYDVMQQFLKLDQNIEKIDSADLDESQKDKNFREIYDSSMKFTIVSIDKLLVETAHETVASTAHEQWFQKTYGNQLMHACHLLQSPISRKDYRQGWECFQQVLAFFSSKVVGN
jgi:PI-3-kinase-related kinase SMG-1